MFDIKANVKNRLQKFLNYNNSIKIFLIKKKNNLITKFLFF